MLGLFTRISGVLLFVLLITIHHRNPVILNSGDTLLRLATFYLIFTRAGDAFSLDRLIALARGRVSGPPRPRAPWAMRLIQIQLSFVYLYAFIWKAMGPMWLHGTAVYYTARLAEFWRFPVPYIFEHMWTIKLWTWSTLVIEFSLATLIWVKELRYWVLLAGLLLHAGIDYSMNIPLFGFIMISMYLTFIEPEDLERFFARARALLNSRSKETLPLPVFYDAKCSFCVRSIEVIRALDVFHRLAFHGMQEPETKRIFPDFDAKRGERELLVRSRGEWLGGFEAFRRIAWVLPMAWPMLPFLYLPKISGPGNRLYQRIAQRRYCILNHSP
jgi:predicted DCC family thiol-disulfide oxidoreductase YuxK